jgi:UDP-N-acetylmuramyl pentapeptide phosphotransferase/UDP-N-acetylglucosamine-1-phosphate transferase
MKTQLKRQDAILITIGLVGAVLLWINVDPGGWLLYFSFLLFGSLRVVDYFNLSPYQRTRPQILKFVFSLLMIITVITHVMWGGEPLFGLLATLLLLYSIANVEPRESNVPESEA